jgi:hypothetical protein
VKLKTAAIAIVLLVAELGAQQPVPPPPPRGATIHGFLFDAVSGSRINGTVVLQDLSRRPVKQAFTTGKELEYRFTDIPEGSYFLHIQGFFGRYIEQDYGQFHPDDPPRELRLTAGTSIEISFMVERSGSISGRLNDPDGRPVQNAELQLLTLRYDAAGRRFLAPAANLAPARLSAGNYSFSNVPPGEYYVRATVALPQQRGAPTLVNHNVRTYYPGTKNSDEAVPVVMPRSSTALPNINFFFKEVSPFKITGKILFPTQGSVKEPLYTYLVPRESLYSRLVDPPHPLLDFDPSAGGFELRNVPPGHYDLYAGSITDYVPTPAGAPNFPGYSARVALEVRDRDIVDLVAELKPGVDLPGKFTLDKSTLAESGKFAGFLPVFFPQDGKPWPLAPAASAISTFTQSDGTFTLIHAAAGGYRIGALIPPDLYLADAWLGPRNIMGQPFEIDSRSEGPLVLELRSDGAKFEGAVTDVDTNVPANAVVVLVPPPEFRDDPGVSKTARTDKDGRFTISGIRPGMYTAYAFPKIDNNAWLNDDFMSPYRALGLQINFSRGSQVYRDFKSVPMPR